MLALSNCRIDQAHAHAEMGETLVFRVNPSVINKLIKKECRVGNDWLQQKPFFDFFVIGGDWDREYSWVSEDRNFKEMGQLLKYRENFRESEAYAKCVEEFLAGCPQKGKDGTLFSSLEEIDEAFRHYLDLIGSMEAGGYQPVLQTAKKEGERHIGVAITRDGELFHFRTGHHRLAIAKQLGLSSVYVHVHCVHSEWADMAMRRFGGSELQAIKQSIMNLAKE